MQNLPCTGNLAPQNQRMELIQSVLMLRYSYFTEDDRMKLSTGVTIVFGIIMALLLASAFRNRTLSSDGRFSTRLYPKFQSKGCTNCHDFYEKKLNGLSFTTHKNRTAEKCVECHDREVTGFTHADEWFSRPGLYTSDMNVQQTCETIKVQMHASFKHQAKLARELTTHLFESPRVLWGIAGATPKSGRLPNEKFENDLIQGGMKQWKSEVDAWIKGGMKCD